jgi:predicted DNA-binding transcriptional regulator AlpA
MKPPMEEGPRAASRILSIEQAAEITPLSKSSLYREAPKPDSPFRKRAGRWLVVESDLLEWIRSGAKPRSQPAQFPMPRPRQRRKSSFGARVAQIEREAA